jgi:hypothetical protein
VLNARTTTAMAGASSDVVAVLIIGVVIVCPRRETSRILGV